ncbi:hypothetical protein TIFTF001_012281 [Ficus carica]|uniref:Uncharacterized protein n=1 Tax=Ficus carica TaxID=3494 RepID=A0AA88D539_FICCA|nr:hypothetical protein TIFTF001_012281 [Ficus carica]
MIGTPSATKVVRSGPGREWVTMLSRFGCDDAASTALPSRLQEPPAPSTGGGFGGGSNHLGRVGDGSWGDCHWGKGLDLAGGPSLGGRGGHIWWERRRVGGGGGPDLEPGLRGELVIPEEEAWVAGKKGA